jgi:hypothetical protein
MLSYHLDPADTNEEFVTNDVNSDDIGIDPEEEMDLFDLNQQQNLEAFDISEQDDPAQQDQQTKQQQHIFKPHADLFKLDMATSATRTSKHNTTIEAMSTIQDMPTPSFPLVMDDLISEHILGASGNNGAKCLANVTADFNRRYVAATPSKTFLESFSEWDRNLMEGLGPLNLANIDEEEEEDPADLPHAKPLITNRRHQYTNELDDATDILTDDAIGEFHSALEMQVPDDESTIILEDRTQLDLDEDHDNASQETISPSDYPLISSIFTTSAPKTLPSSSSFVSSPNISSPAVLPLYENALHLPHGKSSSYGLSNTEDSSGPSGGDRIESYQGDFEDEDMGDHVIKEDECVSKDGFDDEDSPRIFRNPEWSCMDPSHVIDGDGQEENLQDQKQEEDGANNIFDVDKEYLGFNGAGDRVEELLMLDEEEAPEGFAEESQYLTNADIGENGVLDDLSKLNLGNIGHDKTPLAETPKQNPQQHQSPLQLQLGAYTNLLEDKMWFSKEGPTPKQSQTQQNQHQKETSPTQLDIAPSAEIDAAAILKLDNDGFLEGFSQWEEAQQSLVGMNDTFAKWNQAQARQQNNNLSSLKNHSSNDDRQAGEEEEEPSLDWLLHENERVLAGLAIDAKVGSSSIERCENGSMSMSILDMSMDAPDLDQSILKF